VLGSALGKHIEEGGKKNKHIGKYQDSQKEELTRLNSMHMHGSEQRHRRVQEDHAPNS